MGLSIILLYFAVHLKELRAAEPEVECAICAALGTAYKTLAGSVQKSDFSPDLLREPGQLKLNCVTSPGNPNAIGVVQRLRINAPLQQVLAVIDDFGSYANLFPELVKVEAVPGKDPNNFVVKWTEKAPVFFMRDPVHELDYSITTLVNERKTYRSSLKTSRHLKYSEGLIVAIADGPTATWYTELDFYDADWSLLKMLGTEKIWEENVRQLALSDYALKIKAEAPKMASRDARERARKSLDRGLVDQCFKNKTVFTEPALIAMFKAPAPKDEPIPKGAKGR